MLIDARLMCRAACMDMGVSTSRSSLVKDYSTLGDMAPRTNKRVCSTPRRATVSSGTTLVRINSAPQAVQDFTCTSSSHPS